MKPANYAPVYAGLYPELAEIAREHGYAMAVHGSFAKDADLICIPWTNEAAEPEAVVNAIISRFVIRRVGEPSSREHGRIVYTLTIAPPACFIDLSFTPRARAEQRETPSVVVGEIAGYVNVYLDEDGDLRLGGTDVYPQPEPEWAVYADDYVGVGEIRIVDPASAAPTSDGR